MTLTVKKIRDAKPSDKALILWDDDPVGLGLRIWPSGKKVFILNYRIDGVSRRMNLGTASEFSLEQIREAAREAMRRVRAGDDPLDGKRDRAALPTVSEGLDKYLSQHLPARQAKGRLAKKTAYEYQRQIEKNIRPVIGKKRIRDVSRRDIEKVLDPLPPIMANRVCSLLSALFNLFEHWEYRPQHTNPARGIERALEQPRDRTLSENELFALGEALTALEKTSPTAMLAIRLAALTGLRISEVINIRWENISFETSALILPVTKTGRRIHTLPAAAQELLAGAFNEDEFVIAGRFAGKPLNYTTVRKHWVNACKKAGIDGIKLHDLRRTIMTEAAALGVGAHLLRDMVGHKTTAMADRYIRQTGAPLQELRKKMGETISSRMSGASKADVIPIFQKEIG